MHLLFEYVIASEVNVWLSWAGERADSVWVWNTGRCKLSLGPNHYAFIPPPGEPSIFSLTPSRNKDQPSLKKYEHDVRSLTHPTTPDSVAQGNPFGDVEGTQSSSLANYKSTRALLLKCWYDSTDVRVRAQQCDFYCQYQGWVLGSTARQGVFSIPTKGSWLGRAYTWRPKEVVDPGHYDQSPQYGGRSVVHSGQYDQSQRCARQPGDILISGE